MKQQHWLLKTMVFLTVLTVLSVIGWTQWIPYNQKQMLLQTIDEWRFQPLTAKVIASDTIALPQSGVLLTITGEGAVDDDLSIITGGVAGDMVWIRPGSTSQTITLKHATAGSPAGGNVTTPGAVDYAIPDYGYVQLQCNGASWISVCPAVAGVGGLGDFVGPSSATDNAVVRFNGTTGKLGQNSGLSVSDAGGFTSAAASTVESSLTLGKNTQTGSLSIYSEQGGTDYLWTLQPNATMTASFTESMAAALPGGTAFDKCDATGTHSWDTSVYLTAEDDTLATVTARGETATANIILPNGGLLKTVNGSFQGSDGETTLTATRARYRPDLSGEYLVRDTSTPAQGDILYWNGTGWADLAAGTSGKVLQTNGAGANPSWETASGSGGVLQGKVAWGTTMNLYPANEGLVAGNARGESSVDFQTSRSGATMVASGVGATLLAGRNSRASGAYSLSGMDENVADGTGGLVLGKWNSSTADAVTVFGYYNSTSSTAHYSWVPGGLNASPQHTAGGSWASGRHSTNGDTQSCVLSLFGVTTNATPTEISIDGSGSAYFTITSGDSYSFHAYVFGAQVSGALGLAGDSWYYELSGIIVNIAGTTTVRPNPVIQTVVFESLTDCDATITADDANDRLALSVTGATSRNLRWRCRINAEKIDFVP